MWHTACSSFVALVVGLSLLWWQTDGLRAFTQESARRLQISKKPLHLRSVQLEMHNSEIRDWSEFDNRFVIVDFIFTRCVTLCTTLGHEFRRIQQDAEDLIQSGELTLLSVSIDPSRDGPKQLRSYVHRYSSDDESWQAARTLDFSDTSALLDEFGVVVIPDGWGGFIHNTALHLVAPGGRLIKIADYSEYSTLLTEIRACTNDNLDRCSDGSV